MKEKKFHESLPLIDAHTHKPGTNRCICLVDNHPQEKYYSLGIHPWNIHEHDWKIQMESLEKTVLKKKPSAIGECGLDRICGIDLALQNEAFLFQLKLAKKMVLPLVLHNVRATSDFLEIFRREQPQIPLIFHDAHLNETQIHHLLNYPSIFSFSPRIFSRKKSLAVLKKIPLQKILLETDDTGEEIDKHYSKIALFLDLSPELLIKTIHQNFFHIFSSPFGGL